MSNKNLPTELLECAVGKSSCELDQAVAALKQQEGILQLLMGEERLASTQISDDHIYADEKKITFSTMFPDVHGTVEAL